MAAGCRFCSAHTASYAHQFGGSPTDKVAALWDFETSDLFTEAERAALRMAAAAGTTPNGVADEHFVALQKYFDDEQILELVAVIAFYGFFNRWNDTLATPLEDPPLRFALDHLAKTGWAAPTVSDL
jgi:alkylhydroperoxidase family enzyme